MIRPAHLPTHPRALHPGAWWLWAVALAAAVSRTTNPVICLLVLAVVAYVVMARRSLAPWAYAFGAFLRLGLIIIAVRVVLQAVLSSQSQGIHVIVELPEVPMPEWAAGLKLGGLITWEAVMVAFVQGMQLATIICCIGAANALASAQRLLRCVPGALYEVGVAAVVAMTFAPQLVADAARVRAAQRLRGRDRISLGGVWRRTAMPVLEGALDRSVDMAAAMDSRGYGRTSQDDPRTRRLTGVLVFTGVLGLMIGVYGLLDASAQVWMGTPMLAAGSMLAALGLWVGGRRTRRTRYRPDPWALPEWLVVASGVACAALLFWMAQSDPVAARPVDPLAWPAVPALALLATACGVLPAFVAPPPPDHAPRRADRGPRSDRSEAGTPGGSDPSARHGEVAA
jgi:energy-coupling factor transport system permease protein